MEGLTEVEARKSLKQYGPNTLSEKREFSAAGIFAHQFASPLIYVLIGAVGATLVIGDVIDALIIGLAVGINTILGFIQEYKAETTIDSLKHTLTLQAKVIRDGRQVVIPAAHVVPGDIVLLSPGDRVPADGRAIDAATLFINESMLSGESVPVQKIPHFKLHISNSLYMGTIVVSGRGKMEVTATGTQTTIGGMAQTIETTHKEETPLQKELGALGKKLTLLVLAACIVIFFSGVITGQSLPIMLSTAVAIAVSAIPEGLVVSLTVILALGMQRVMKRNALVRRMVAAETLGSVSVICVDKTGTITQGVMRVVREEFGKYGKSGQYRGRALAIRAAILANNLEDPLEIALWDWAKTKDHADPQNVADSSPRISEEPFDSVKKYMSVTTSDGVWLKGAPEAILAMYRLTSKEKHAWLSMVNEWGSEGLRVIALGYRGNRGEGIFLGLVGISDPVRKGVAQAVAHVRSAGIRVVMVTGDYRATADAVMRQIGIPIDRPDWQILDGTELAAMSQEDLAGRIDDVRLFCRVSPQQKHMIVAAYQAAGEVVAMTGDGVNDAAAIKKADIGIVVKGASDVARQTADMMLLDANFQTIAAAIEEGRAIFQNIRTVTQYLVGNAFVEMMIIASAIALGFPLPITAIQILWINLVVDGIPALALAVEDRTHALMKAYPRSRATPIFSRTMMVSVATMSVLVTAGALVLFAWFGGRGDMLAGRTAAFTFVTMSTMLYAYSCRAGDATGGIRAFVRNRWLATAIAIGLALQWFAVGHPWGNHVFGTVPLALPGWVAIAGSCLAIVGMIEGVKRIR
jgi:Ca2+-transporting ATPase